MSAAPERAFTVVGRNVAKSDALALAVGTERFTGDFSASDALSVAVLLSPHPHADIIRIDTSEAEKVPGVVDILHHGNVPGVLHTTAGQGYPEPSPYDTLLFDSKVRFVGDRVALVAAETKEAALTALGKIVVDYVPLEPLFDPERAMEEDAPRLHGDDAYAPLPVAYDAARNLAGEIAFTIGDLEKGFAEADFVEEQVYHTHITAHCALEPHCASACLDERGRLVVISSTQVPFHARRTTARLLGIPTGMVRVVKPRLGGGFGSKQEVLVEPLVAMVTWRTGRPATYVCSRKEVFLSTRTRHAMRVRLKTGMMRDGTITALSMDALMNAGAYGPHALTVVSVAGGKSLPLFNKIPNLRFLGRSVYTTLPVGGAYRGYGATQAFFGLNQHVDILARRVGQDFLDYVKRWHIREGETSPVFRALGEGKEGVDQIIRSCKLDECIDRGAEAIGWREKRGKRLSPAPGRVRGVGAAVSMQGSGIPGIDMAAASMKMNEDGSFNLLVGAADIGTGADTILAQIAAEVLGLPVEKILVLSGDTDVTPFDVGAYASSTTYVSGNAVAKCAGSCAAQILAVAADMLGAQKEDLCLENGSVRDLRTDKRVAFGDVAVKTLYGHDQFQIQAQASYVGSESPPPFMAQFAEVEVDLETGKVAVLDFVSAVDCGQPIHPRLVEGQVEGATLNGIAYALWEEYRFDGSGRMRNPSFWDYKIPTLGDVPRLRTIVVSSHEATGPFGAKSVSEIGINGPAPAIANAIYDATGVRLFDLPFTPEKVLQALRANIPGQCGADPCPAAEGKEA